VLEYLVTSRARRELLKLLWLAGREASGRALAEAAGISTSLANRELKAMKSAGLAKARTEGAATLYRAATDHPDADLLRALLVARSAPPTEEADRETRALLAALGAPLVVDEPTTEEPDPEESLARGLELAHRDPSVVRAMPVLLSRLAPQLELDRLESLAGDRGLRRTLGFFADLTSTLAGPSRLAPLARRLRDRRRTRVAPFFSTPASRFEEALMKERTPEVARRWHFLMNMPIEDLQAFFARHAKT
jgi:hypothetical protein